MSNRYIAHTAESFVGFGSAKDDILGALTRNVELVRKNTPGASEGRAGVYVGIAGTVIMGQHLLHLQRLYPSPEYSNLIAFTDAHLCTALAIPSRPLDPAHASFLETSIGVFIIAILRALRDPQLITQSHREARKLALFSRNWPVYVHDIKQTVEMTMSEDGRLSKSRRVDDGGSEVLYGRAGLLYAILRLRSALSVEGAAEVTAGLRPLVDDSIIQGLVNSIIRRGKAGSALYAAEVSQRHPPALMWSWHGKRYLGAAHGVAGILHMLLLSPLNIVAPHMGDILNTTEWLVDCQDPTGNWPSSAPKYTSSSRKHHSRDGNELLHWCHGATGILILLSTVLRLGTSTDSHNSIPVTTALRGKILTALQRGASLVYTNGLLRKGVGLCHGVAGSVYALLAVSDTLDHQPHNNQETNATYLSKALHLAHLATSHAALTSSGEMRVPDRPWSLYEGMAGMCCAWADVLYRFEAGNEGRTVGRGGCGMPGFDDLHLQAT